MRLVVLLPVVCAALVMSADGVEIGVVRERILRDQRNVASVNSGSLGFFPGGVKLSAKIMYVGLNRRDQCRRTESRSPTSPGRSGCHPPCPVA